jgi:hypothetical protein
MIESESENRLTFFYTNRGRLSSALQVSTAQKCEPPVGGQAATADAMSTHARLTKK